MEHDLERLNRIPNNNAGWPLPVLQTASQRTTLTCVDGTNTVTSTNDAVDDVQFDGGRILEQMLDEERVPVLVWLFTL